MALHFIHPLFVVVTLMFELFKHTDANVSYFEDCATQHKMMHWSYSLHQVALHLMCYATILNNASTKILEFVLLFCPSTSVHGYWPCITLLFPSFIIITDRPITVRAPHRSIDPFTDSQYFFWSWMSWSSNFEILWWRCENNVTLHATCIKRLSWNFYPSLSGK